jgi:hypothetical protein
MSRLKFDQLEMGRRVPKNPKNSQLTHALVCFGIKVLPCLKYLS